MSLYIILDECRVSNPCKNGAQCSDLRGSYTCKCKSGYQGKNCESGKITQLHCRQREKENPKDRHEQRQFSAGTRKTDKLINTMETVITFSAKTQGSV